MNFDVSPGDLRTVISARSVMNALISVLRNVGRTPSVRNSTA